MKNQYLLCCAMVYVLMTGNALAAGIDKIVHADGQIEYRQAQQQPVVAAAQSHYYRYRNADGVLSFSDRQPVDGHYERLRFDCYACNLSSSVVWETTPLFHERYQEAIEFYAHQYAVSPALVRAVIHAESAFNPRALSRVGAQGLMQLMPATARELGVQDAFDPDGNIEGGVRYLAQLLQSFNQDVRLATAAYNAGPGTVRRYQGVPDYAETRAYVERVSILARRYAREG